MLAVTTQEHPHEWAKYVKAVTFAYNSANQSTIGCSPCEAFLGLVPQLPTSEDLAGLTGTIILSEREMANIARTLEKNTQDRTAKNAFQYDKKRVMADLKPGDLVIKLDESQAARGFNKLAPKYLGPFKVDSIMTNNVVKLDNDETVNVSKLKRYHQRAENTLRTTTARAGLGAGIRAACVLTFLIMATLCTTALPVKDNMGMIVLSNIRDPCELPTEKVTERGSISTSEQYNIKDMATCKKTFGGTVLKQLRKYCEPSTLAEFIKNLQAKGFPTKTQLARMALSATAKTIAASVEDTPTSQVAQKWPIAIRSNEEVTSAINGIE